MSILLLVFALFGSAVPISQSRITFASYENFMCSAHVAIMTFGLVALLGAWHDPVQVVCVSAARLQRIADCRANSLATPTQRSHTGLLTGHSLQESASTLSLTSSPKSRDRESRLSQMPII